MPVVLTEVGGVARSGHHYGDRTGIEYEYPRGRYENWIRPGERFVYQKPKIGYVGCGLIGEIRESNDPDRLICEVLSVSMFENAVPLKDGDGQYYEADTQFWKDKVYWGQGVRPLSNPRLDAIISAGGVPPDFAPDAKGSGYATPEVARKVEDYSVSVAANLMQERFGAAVHVMPRNNPGFDLLVGSRAAPTRFVEVKGTQTAAPVFFISEGERKFSIANSSLYTLVVVCGIDLTAGDHAFAVVRDGEVTAQNAALAATQWRGELPIET